MAVRRQDGGYSGQDGGAVEKAATSTSKNFTIFNKIRFDNVDLNSLAH